MKSRGCAAFLMTVAAVTAMLVPTSAQADSVWHQSVGRTSATATCPADDFGTPWQSNWDPAERPWRPSWSQWPNGGTGGFTCDRQITWARSSHPVGYCQGAGSTFYQFNGGWYLDSIRNFVALTVYPNNTCTGGSASGQYEQLVYAPAGFSPAALCTEVAGFTITSPTSLGGDVYRCRGIA